MEEKKEIVERTETGTSKNTKNTDQFMPRTKKRIFFVMGFLCCFVLMILLNLLHPFGRFVLSSEYNYYKELEQSYGKYNEILRLIGENPIAKSKPGEIDDAKLKELVASIGDPYAEYFTAEEYKEFEKNYASDYVGVGIGVMESDEGVVIVNVFNGSPAEEAGIIAGDIIKTVDGKAPKDSAEAVSLISGETGDAVEIVVKRGDEELTFNMNRAKIDYDSVIYDELEDNPEIGYIKITGFRKDTAKDFELAVRDLKKKGCKKFIIDLRDNGGGLTDESIEMADYLLPACKIMSETGKNGDEKVYNSKASSADLDFVVLTNINTASASEILAGAIQDNKAGLIIGQKTYGKGVTQITRRFRDGSAIKMTVSEYFRPSGDTVNGTGITPDIKTKEGEEIDAAIKELTK